MRVGIKWGSFAKGEGKHVSSVRQMLPLLKPLLFRCKWVLISLLPLGWLGHNGVNRHVWDGQKKKKAFQKLGRRTEKIQPPYCFVLNDVSNSQVWQRIKIMSQEGWLSSESGTEGQRTKVFTEMLEGWENCINAGYYGTIQTGKKSITILISSHLPGSKRWRIKKEAWGKRRKKERE